MKQIKQAARHLSKTIGMTLGPHGRNVGILLENGKTLITNDGVTIARHIKLQDPSQNMAAQVLVQASLQTNHNAGDGTTSAIILATDLIKRGSHAIKRGKSVVTLKSELTIGANQACKMVEQISIGCENIYDVAFNSCQNEKISNITTDAFKQVGINGIVSLEENNLGKTELIFSDGCEVNACLVSPYMIENPQALETHYQNPNILLTNQAIKSVNDIVHILEISQKPPYNPQETPLPPLVIFSPDFSQEATNTVLVNRVRGGIKVILVKLNEYTDRLDATLGDLSSLTGATIISAENDLKLSDIDLNHLGTCEKVVSNLELSRIVTNRPFPEFRVKQIRAQIDNASDEYTKHRLCQRLAKLTSGIATISIGAPTDAELKELKLRAEDAIAATRAALREGVVPGAGLAYIAVAKTDSKILNKSLYSINKRLRKNNSGARFAPLHEGVIIDPSTVIKQVILNATSAASTLLTTGAFIVNNQA